MSNLFSSFADSVIQKIETKIAPIQEVDPLYFITSSAFMNEDPTPFQRVLIKTLYSLWDLYPPDQDELELLSTLKRNWGIEIKLDRVDPVLNLVLCLGRRSTKSTISAFIASISMYQLICKGNPQEYYGIRERHPIYVVHMASAGSQATDVFSLTSNCIKKVPFFLPYIDFDKDNSTELRLRSPYDLYLNDEIRRRNLIRPEGTSRENLLPGSLNIKSVTTSASSHRGEAIITLILSEFAHFQRTNMTSKASEGGILEENPRSDYAVYKALAPSVKDFGRDGKIILESSPSEKGGEFYFHYCCAGGIEQEKFEEVTPDPDYALIQLATWEARPSLSQESFRSDFRKDPVGANSEYGAHFRNPSGSFITETLISSIPVPNRPLIRINPSNWRFIICIDAGGKAKSKPADTYALGWGHAEKHSLDTDYTYWIDGFNGWDMTTRDLGGGMIEKIPVDPNIVLAYIRDLVRDFGGRNYLIEICYDQWENTAAISTLQSEGYTAIETTFTNSYKSSMYGNFLAQLQLGRVKMYGEDVNGWIERWKLEMKYLQRISSGGYTYYKHPESGPVQHDDFADVSANIVHRLLLQTDPTKESIKQAQRTGAVPIQYRKTLTPVRAAGFQLGKSSINRFRR